MRTVGGIGIGWALALGLALVLIVGGAALVTTTAEPTPATTQGMDTGDEVSMEEWPSADALSTELAREFSPNDTGNVTIALAARWGYLDDPAVMAMEGRWHFNDTGTGGEFAGEWHLIARRIGGSLHGRFSLPPDGRGEFRAQWNVPTAGRAVRSGVPGFGSTTPTGPSTATGTSAVVVTAGPSRVPGFR